MRTRRWLTVTENFARAIVRALHEKGVSVYDLVREALENEEEYINRFIENINVFSKKEAERLEDYSEEEIINILINECCDIIKDENDVYFDDDEISKDNVKWLLENDYKPVLRIVNYGDVYYIIIKDENTIICFEEKTMNYNGRQLATLSEVSLDLALKELVCACAEY